MDRTTKSALIALVFTAQGACSSGEPVPFGLDRPSTRTIDEPSEQPPLEAVDWQTERRGPDASQLIDGLAFSLSSVDSELRFRARLIATRDIDDDGDEDALVFLANHEGAVRVISLRRDEMRYETQSLASFDGKPECHVEDMTFESASGRVALGWQFVCPELVVQRAAIFDTSGYPMRRVETVCYTVEEGESFALRFVDHDEDGNPDISLDMTLAGGSTPAQTSLVFLDRPAGLARERSEPEAQIASLSRSALRLLTRRPVEARGTAKQAIAIFDAICSESRQARLEIGGSIGVPCGRSVGVGRALSVYARAALRMNEPLAALDAIERFDEPGVRVTPRDSSEAREAVAETADENLQIHQGPAVMVEIPPTSSPRLSLLAFRNESQVLVRGPTPTLVDLDTNTTSPSELPGRLALSDGNRRVAAIRRRCEGTMIALLGNDHSRGEVLLDERPPPDGAPCPNLTPNLANDADGWVLLGWAPQGLLAARDLALRVVPLDMQGAPLGDPMVVEPGAAIPAPIAAGHATQDAHAYALANRDGIVLYQLAPQRRARFIRPSGWHDPDGMSIDIALSPSLRRIAWLEDGHLEWIELPDA